MYKYVLTQKSPLRNLCTHGSTCTENLLLCPFVCVCECGCSCESHYIWMRQLHASNGEIKYNKIEDSTTTDRIDVYWWSVCVYQLNLNCGSCHNNMPPWNAFSNLIHMWTIFFWRWQKKRWQIKAEENSLEITLWLDERGTLRLEKMNCRFILRGIWSSTI